MTLGVVSPSNNRRAQDAAFPESECWSRRTGRLGPKGMPITPSGAATIMSVEETTRQRQARCFTEGLPPTLFQLAFAEVHFVGR